MRKLLFIISLFPLIAFGQKTYVPDNNFEAYLEDNSMGDGIANNDSVLTANINGVTELYVNGKNISDLTGIEGFTALSILECISNSIINLDVIQNTDLTYLSCTANSLTSLDVSNNTDLISLNCSGNSIPSLDISNNASLTNVSCAGNQLTCLNIKNGNNTNMYYFNAASNQDLFCIEVDDTTHANTNWVGTNYYFDPQTSFSENCNYPTPCGNVATSWDCINNTCTDPGTGNGAYSTLAECHAACDSTTTSIYEIIENKDLLYITDLLGRSTQPVPYQILIYRYSDGSVDKRMQVDR